MQDEKDSRGFRDGVLVISKKMEFCRSTRPGLSRVRSNSRGEHVLVMVMAESSFVESLLGLR